MKRAKTMDDFCAAFDGHTEVLLSIVKHLEAVHVFRCRDVSQAWSRLWGSNAIWLRLFASSFFAISLHNMDRTLCLALFPRPECWAFDFYVCQAAVSCVHSVRDIMAATTPPPDHSRKLQMQVAFIATLRMNPMTQAQHFFGVKNDLEALCSLQEYWQSRELFVPCAHIRGGDIEGFLCAPPWLRDVVPTVAYERVTNGSVYVTLTLGGQRFLLTYNTDNNVRGGYARMATLDQDSKRRSKSITCRADWAERMSIDMMNFVEMRRDDNLETSAEEFDAHVEYLVWRNHPVNRLSSMAQLLPLDMSAESNRWWFARFIHFALGRFSPYDEFDLGPPSMGAYCFVEDARGCFYNYHKGAHD